MAHTERYLCTERAVTRCQGIELNMAATDSCLVAHENGQCQIANTRRPKNIYIYQVSRHYCELYEKIRVASWRSF